MSIVFEPLAAAPPELFVVLLLLLLPHALSARIEPKTRPPLNALPRTLIYVPPLGRPGLSVTRCAETSGASGREQPGTAYKSPLPNRN